MIKLIAILKSSARAFIEEDESTYHIQPPFDLDSKRKIRKEDVEFATSGYGFINLDEEFENYADLTRYLVVEYKGSSENKKYDIDLNFLLSAIPPSFVNIYIKKLRELIQINDYKTVLKVVTLLKNNRSVSENKKIEDEVNELEEQANQLLLNEVLSTTTTIFTNIKSNGVYMSDLVYSKRTDPRLKVVTYNEYEFA